MLLMHYILSAWANNLRCGEVVEVLVFERLGRCGCSMFCHSLFHYVAHNGETKVNKRGGS